MKKLEKADCRKLLCAAAAVLIGLVHMTAKQSREFSSSSAMMNTAVSADIEGKRREKRSARRF